MEHKHTAKHYTQTFKHENSKQPDVLCPVNQYSYIRAKHILSAHNKHQKHVHAKTRA